MQYLKLFPDRACYGLGQSAKLRPTTATTQGQWPCFRKGGTAKLWCEPQRRWITAHEKAGMMGWPVTEDTMLCESSRETCGRMPRVKPVPHSICYLLYHCQDIAATAGVPVHAASTVTHGQIGNAMHVATVGAVMLVTLMCFERVPAASSHDISANRTDPGGAANPAGTSDASSLPDEIKWSQPQQCFFVKFDGVTRKSFAVKTYECKDSCACHTGLCHTGMLCCIERCTADSICQVLMR